MALTATLGFIGGRRSSIMPSVEKSDTIIIRDTFIDYRPAPLSVTPLRVETVRLPLSGLAFARFADDITSVGDTVFLQIRDTVEVEVPIVFSRYRGDNYDIGVSGLQDGAGVCQGLSRDQDNHKRLCHGDQTLGLRSGRRAVRPHSPFRQGQRRTRRDRRVLSPALAGVHSPHAL